MLRPRTNNVIGGQCWNNRATSNEQRGGGGGCSVLLRSNDQCFRKSIVMLKLRKYLLNFSITIDFRKYWSFDHGNTMAVVVVVVAVGNMCLLKTCFAGGRSICGAGCSIGPPIIGGRPDENFWKSRHYVWTKLLEFNMFRLQQEFIEKIQMDHQDANNTNWFTSQSDFQKKVAWTDWGQWVSEHGNTVDIGYKWYAMLCVRPIHSHLNCNPCTQPGLPNTQGPMIHKSN